MEKFNSFQQSINNLKNRSTEGFSEKRTDTRDLSNGLRKYAQTASSANSLLPDLICFSHLRWDFVYQRPQHLLSRCAKERRVYFVEEPIFTETTPKLEISQRDNDVYVVVPFLPNGLSEAECIAAQQALVIDDLILTQELCDYILWYYTPMARAFTQHLEPLAIIYDCMDELSAFKNPPPRLKEFEADLLECADLVFTGGYSLFEAKRHLHTSMYPFPSSIEANHFRQARQAMKEPVDQADIPHPRLGFYGVIDERMDLELLDALAKARPDWHYIMVGPVVKIDPADLPKHPNIHYLGGKSYQELPAYLSGWDIATLPFARNESTQFISPTKTPEYLAAGVPVISTSITDVVRPYGQQGLVKIADTANEFIAAAEFLMAEEFNRVAWLRQVDESLMYNNWDRTWARMRQLINTVLNSSYSESNKAETPLSLSAKSLVKSAASQVTGD
jgi:glycosyltransferase involved in cell wall biosynthesis